MENQKRGCMVVVSRDGPYLVSGGLPLAKEIILGDDEGNSVKWGKGEKFQAQETYALCRCGHSNSMPFCDGSHAKVGFDGTETASRDKFEKQAEVIKGPSIDLMDAPQLCASARFCHNKSGSVWEHTRNSGDPESKKIAIQQACNCPGGRLVILDKNKPIEPKFEPSISIVEDTPANVSGPIWVKGGVPIESHDGTRYEPRNRVTLCRCGRSDNKPFCDSTHVSIRFSDGDKRVMKR